MPAIVTGRIAQSILAAITCLGIALTAGCVGDGQRLSGANHNKTLTVTLLFTNDLESAFEPTPAFWRPDLDFIGGIAELATLIDRQRASQPNVFLFDSGDIFTGTLSKLTNGELPFELMLTMGYDAMCIGNHEFEYGWQAFAEQKNRVSFPVLGANLFYKETEIPFAQPYAIFERNGVRLGVIGVLGQDAATALIPSNIAGLEVRDPIPILAELVPQLRTEVDLIVVLTHQGKTAPMQTDDEGRPDVQRDIDADINLAGSVTGIDVLLGGHADAGTRKPVVHPTTGTVIMQTFGQGQHLGFLQLQLDPQSRDLKSFTGKLIAVASDDLPPHEAVLAKLESYRSQYPEMTGRAGETADRLNRRYNLESDLGNLYADILRSSTGADIGLMPSGALRRDLPEGQFSRMNLLDTFPFTDRIALVELSGRTLRGVIEQGLSLERGILQVSGLTVTYNPDAPIGRRVREIKVAEEALDDNRRYQIATIEILAAGGDRYEQFHDALKVTYLNLTYADALQRHFASAGTVTLPPRGRLIPKR